ncbi:MAG: hypothetical protein AAF614_00570 [Chloroflexota bacterium]
MQIFDYKFTVAAPITAVSDFHHDTRILKKLSPPPIFVQIHSFEPLAEGSEAEFTLWFGPIPICWQAIHTDVSQQGFTDSQGRGPMASWQHTHRFQAISANETEVHEHIEYAHKAGWRGWLTRLMFNNLGLYGLFTARKFLTRWHVSRKKRKMVATS